MKLFIFLIGFSLSALAESPGRPEVMKSVDTSVTNIDAAYSGAGGTAFSSLASKNGFAVYNKTAIDVAVSLPTGACSAGSPDHFVVPANGGIIIDKVAVIKSICLRSLGAVISTGLVYVSTW